MSTDASSDKKGSEADTPLGTPSADGAREPRPTADPTLQTFFRNLPPGHQRKDFDRHMRRLGVSFVTTLGHSAPRGITVLFPSEDDKARGEELLTAKRLAGKQLRKTNPSGDQVIGEIRWDERELAKQRTEEEANFALNGNDAGKGKKRGREGGDNAGQPVEIRTKTAQEIVAPLAGKPYPEQLEIKAEAMREVLRKMVRATLGTQREWRQKGLKGPPTGLLRHRTSDGLACPFEGVLPSPVTERYRNKNEFTSGWDEHGVPMLGFVSHRPRVSDEKMALPDVEDPAVFLDPERRTEPVLVDPTPSSTASHAAVAVWNAMQPHILGSGLHPFQRNCTTLDLSKRGFWRMVRVRDTSKGDVMVFVSVNYAGCGGEEKLAEAKASLKALFAEGGAGAAAGVTSLYLQNNDGLNDFCENEPELLSGKATLVETLSGLDFEISHDAFFQTNRAAAEILYGRIADWCDTSGADTTVFDVCCGTGTIGIFLAPRASSVVGIEMVPSAIGDAVRNAERNGVQDKCTFVVGKVEDKLKEELRKLKPRSRAVAVVDPPRPGLHMDVLRNLRNRADLDAIVYVACNPNTVTAAMKALAGPISNKFNARPFHPVKSVAVDMFPGTPHCEFVVLFEREKDEVAGKGKDGEGKEAAEVKGEKGAE